MMNEVSLGHVLHCTVPALPGSYDFKFLAHRCTRALYTSFDSLCLMNTMVLSHECTNLPPRDKWRYIFVVPDDVELL
jgi:hypothetical protein